jgi:hypothetical protein
MITALLTVVGPNGESLITVHRWLQLRKLTCVFSFSSNELMIVAQSVFKRTPKLANSWLGYNARVDYELAGGFVVLEPKNLKSKAYPQIPGTTSRSNSGPHPKRQIASRCSPSCCPSLFALPVQNSARLTVESTTRGLLQEQRALV